MTELPESPIVLLHVSGPDRPGITSFMTKILAEEDARLLDIGQSVLHHFLILSAVAEIPKGSDALRKLLFAASHLGLKLEVSTLPPQFMNPAHVRDSMCMTMLGDLEDGKAVARITSFLAEKSFNIRDIKTLSVEKLRGLELIVEIPETRPLSASALRDIRGEILQLAIELKLDIAVQRDDIFRRNKRLVCMDVDSTFIQMEVIDELARLQGCEKKVSDITERAMNGQLDFKQALKERVALLEGLEVSKAQSLLENIPMSPGAETLVKVLKKLGYKIGLVSGGFDFFVEHLKDKFNLDFAFANHLESKNGKFTGRTTGTVVDAERKAQLLKDMCQVYSCPMEQSVAVGDGANDLLMLQSAGLGIAFRAKARLQKAADLNINHSLDNILFLMGYRAEELLRI